MSGSKQQVLVGGGGMQQRTNIRLLRDALEMKELSQSSRDNKSSYRNTKRLSKGIRESKRLTRERRVSALMLMRSAYLFAKSASARKIHGAAATNNGGHKNDGGP
jgi:hypothetical protein